MKTGFYADTCCLEDLQTLITLNGARSIMAKNDEGRALIMIKQDSNKWEIHEKNPTFSEDWDVTISSTTWAWYRVSYPWFSDAQVTVEPTSSLNRSKEWENWLVRPTAEEYEHGGV